MRGADRQKCAAEMPSLTQIPEDPSCQSQSSSLTQTSEYAEGNDNEMYDTKEENVNDEPEARMGRLSETGKQLFGVIQRGIEPDQRGIFGVQSSSIHNVSQMMTMDAAGMNKESHKKKPIFKLDLSSLGAGHQQ